MTRSIKDQSQAVEIAGIILTIDYDLIPGYPGTRLDPPEADEYSIKRVKLGAIDLLPVFEAVSRPDLYAALDDILHAAITGS